MKTLKRIPHRGVIAGVIAGFADYFGVEVTLMRIIFVLFVLATGFFPGIVGYLVAALIMPVETPIIHEHQEGAAHQQQ